jgi:hypothetical protein
LKTRSVLAVLGVIACAATIRAPVAHADGVAGPLERVDKATCLDAVSKGQRLRDTHKLVEAREKFRVCARAECPTVVQTDCAGWLADVERTLPTVVLSAKAHGRDVVDVKVTVDDVPLASTLDGQAVPVNPGLRTFRFERAGGASATVQKLVKEGEKAQGVAVVLSGLEPASTALAAPGPGSETYATANREPISSRSGTTVRLLGLLIGGAGVLGMGAGLGVAIDAKAKDNSAANEPGTLRQTDSASAVSEGNVATVLLGVGTAMAVAGVVLWIAAPRARSDGPSTTATTPKHPTMGTDGRGLLLWGSF